MKPKPARWLRQDRKPTVLWRSLQVAQHLGEGRYSRSGANTVLVTRDSATSGHCFDDTTSTIQIDENHSDMVKFPSGGHKVFGIASKLADICGIQAFQSRESTLPEMAGSGTISNDTNIRKRMFDMLPPITASSETDEEFRWGYGRK